jgi:hypothetical protein
MTVRVILPHISAASLPAGRRVAAFFNMKSTNMPTIAALAVRTANRAGIIRLTLTA